MVYFYAAWAVCVTIFSTGRKFHPVLNFEGLVQDYTWGGLGKTVIAVLLNDVFVWTKEGVSIMNG